MFFHPGFELDELVFSMDDEYGLLVTAHQNHQSLKTKAESSSVGS